MTDKLGPYELNTIVTGDARELAKAIPDESVDLIFTDPVYSQIEDYEWLAETAARVLKPDRACLVFCGIGWKDLTIESIKKHLSYRWDFCIYLSNNMNIAGSNWLYRKWQSLLWIEKGIANPRFRIQDLREAPISGTSNHQWSKRSAIYALGHYLDAFSLPDSIIFDPFTGGGTVPAVCKMLTRNYLAFEIDPETADLARERVRLTQPPLPIEYPEQLSFEVVA